MFCRTCQECGHIQESKKPDDYKSDVWRDTKCRKCKSSSLDYGSESFEVSPSGKITKKQVQHSSNDEGDF